MGNVIIDSFKLKSLLTQTLEINQKKLDYILKVLNKELNENTYLDVYLVKDIFEKIDKSLHPQMLNFLFDILENDEYSFKEISKLIRELVLPELYIQKGVEFLDKKLNESEKIFIIRIGSNNEIMKPRLSSKIIEKLLGEFDYYFFQNKKLFNELKNVVKKSNNITYKSILGYCLYKNFTLLDELTAEEFQNIFQDWSEEFYFELEASNYLLKLQNFEKNNQITVLTKFRIASLMKDSNLIQKYSMEYFEEKGVNPQLPRKLTINQIFEERAYKDFLDLKNREKKYTEDEVYNKLNNIFENNENISLENIKEVYLLYKENINQNIKKISKNSYQNLLENILSQKEGFELYINILKTKSKDLIGITEYLSKILKEIEVENDLEIKIEELIEEIKKVVELFEDTEIIENYKGITSIDYFIKIFFEVNINNQNFFINIKELRNTFPKNISYYLGKKIGFLYKNGISGENKEYVLNSLNKEMLIGVCCGDNISKEILLELFENDLIINIYNKYEFKELVSSIVLDWTLWLYSIKKINRKSLQKIEKTKYIYSKAFEFVVYNENLELAIRKVLYEDILMNELKKEEYKSKVSNYNIFLEILEKDFLDPKGIEKILIILFETSKNRILNLETGKKIIEKLNKIKKSYTLVFLLCVFKDVGSLCSREFLEYILSNMNLFTIQYEVIDKEIDHFAKGYLKENMLNIEKINQISYYYS
ncbi:MAG: hypothetical protein ACRCZI_08895 [Cetobacterium sp.]